MIFERFSRGTTPLHRADVRVKIVGASGLTLAVALAQDYRTALLGLLLGLTLMHVARLRVTEVIKRLLVVNSFTLFLWLTLPITYPGEVLASIGPFSISSQGVLLTTLITIKTNAIILMLIALLSTSPVADLGHGLTRLRFPEKLCLLLLFSYRYIFVIYQEYQRLRRAATLRCFSPATDMHTYRTFGYLFGMTLLKSWRRADRVSQAMALRGFSGKFYSLNERQITGNDKLFLVVLMAAAVILAILENLYL